MFRTGRHIRKHHQRVRPPIYYHRFYEIENYEFETISNSMTFISKLSLSQMILNCLRKFQQRQRQGHKNGKDKCTKALTLREVRTCEERI
jgi:hypothetical protein